MEHLKGSHGPEACNPCTPQDCEFTYLSTQILHLLGAEGPQTKEPAKCVAAIRIASLPRFPTTQAPDMHVRRAVCGSSRLASEGNRHDPVIPVHRAARPAVGHRRTHFAARLLTSAVLPLSRL